MRKLFVKLFILCMFMSVSRIALSQVSSVDSLVFAIENGSEGDVIAINPGVYKLSRSLKLKNGMSLVGSGIDKTVITAALDWKNEDLGLPKVENPKNYLINLVKVTKNSISNLTLTGPDLHGAIYAYDADGLKLYNLLIKDFLWSAVRTFRMDNFKAHDNTLIDAGGRFRFAGGAFYLSNTNNSEFWNNLILKSKGSDKAFYGFKGRQAKDTRFHHNDVRVNFSLEFPFENERNIEIDHNRFDGAISIPKSRGGPLLTSGLSFHIHHNWLKKSYSLEWARNNTEINNNLFDFDECLRENKDDLCDDRGNLITNHGVGEAPGFTYFHDNLIKNPGRGIFWSKGVYNNFYFYNNHIKANSTTRKDGFFALVKGTDFNTIIIKDNIFENTPNLPRPLMRYEASLKAVIENNDFFNISDSNLFLNPAKNRPKGPLERLSFKVGVNSSYIIDNWDVYDSISSTPIETATPIESKPEVTITPFPILDPPLLMPTPTISVIDPNNTPEIVFPIPTLPTLTPTVVFVTPIPVPPIPTVTPVNTLKPDSPPIPVNNEARRIRISILNRKSFIQASDSRLKRYACHKSSGRVGFLNKNLERARWWRSREGKIRKLSNTIDKLKGKLNDKKRRSRFVSKILLKIDLVTELLSFADECVVYPSQIKSHKKQS